MTFTTAGYPGTVNKIEWARMAEFFSLHGTKDLDVQPVSGQDRTVRVTFSRAWAPGVLVTQTSPDDVQLPANGSSNPRRDRIILRHDWEANETTLTSKQGTPSSSPSMPGLTTDPGVLYEHHLAEVRVAPGQGELQTSDIGLLVYADSAPVVRLGDQTARPFARFGALVLDENTGLAIFSDGSSYQPLRVRHQDLDRAILKRNGQGHSGNGALDAGNQGPPSGSYSTSASIGGSWSGGSGAHSSQFRAPKSGLYRVSASARFVGTSSSQTGDVLLDLRRGMQPSNYTSGTAILSARESVMNHNTMVITDIVELNTSTLYGVVLHNASSHQINRNASGLSTHFELNYLGPNS